MYLSDACTLPVNMAGLPGMSDPVRAVRRAAGRAPADRAGLERAPPPAPRPGLRGDHRRAPPGARVEPAGLVAAGDPATPDARGAAPRPFAGGAPDDVVHDRAASTRSAERRALSRAGVRAVPPSGIRRFFDIAATMKDVISLGVGEPDFATPAPGDRGRRPQPARPSGPTTPATTGRSSCAGRSPHHLERRYGVAYDPPSEILVTVGASEALDLACRATLDPGRRGGPPRAVVRRLRAGDRVRRRRRPPRRDPPRG